VVYSVQQLRELSAANSARSGEFAVRLNTKTAKATNAQHSPFALTNASLLAFAELISHLRCHHLL
jgi:hypothetical protein